MSSIVSRCHNSPSAFEYPAPIADAFATRGNNAVSCPMRHQTIRPVGSSAAPLTDLALNMIGFVNASSSPAVLQIPIAT